MAYFGALAVVIQLRAVAKKARVPMNHDFRGSVTTAVPKQGAGPPFLILISRTLTRMRVPHPTRFSLGGVPTRRLVQFKTPRRSFVIPTFRKPREARQFVRRVGASPARRILHAAKKGVKRMGGEGKVTPLERPPLLRMRIMSVKIEGGERERERKTERERRQIREEEESIMLVRLVLCPSFSAVVSPQENLQLGNQQK